MSVRAYYAGLALVLLLILDGGPADAAGPPGKEAGWPCVQQFVPQIAASTVWSGPPLPSDADWQADPTVAALVEAIGPRSVPTEAGEAKIAAFADAVPPEQRVTKLPEAFLGLVSVTNQQRTEIIGRIRELSHRQHEVADLVAQVTDELHSIPQAASGDDADRRAEVVQRRAYLIRDFEETQRTMRYACETPVQLEARLGRYARALQARL
jgi:hypothetical protein